MSRRIAVLRPEPGNRVTAAAIEAAGRTAIRMPLFDVAPVAWEAPDPGRFDALILTSANAVRHSGPGLDALRGLPVYAVGEVTAEAARRAGFAVTMVGSDGAAGLLEQARTAGVRRALHLAGRERTIAEDAAIAEIITVYAGTPLPITTDQAARLTGSVALVQSARAAARLAEIVAPEARATIAIAAIGARAAEAAGGGWEAVRIAPSPTSEALIDTALALAD